jgi:thiamine-monophosphate kinase
MPTLGELGEFEVIRRLTAARATASGLDSGVIVDAGDDAAVVRPRAGADLVVTTDAFVEGRHTLAEWSSPAAIGARLAVANLSDLAAMAATPRWAVLSMGVRAEHDVDALLEFQRGLTDGLARDGARLVGGNLAAVEGAEWFSLTLVGESTRSRTWTRSGARPGDLIAVTGFPGRAGAGFHLAAALRAEARAEAWRSVLDAWLVPRSRVSFALSLAATDGVTAAVDVSDGVAGDLAHLCEASGVGAELDERAWPRDADLERAAARLGVALDALRFGPSDDYELLLAVDPGAHAACEEVARAQEVPLTFVGRISDAPGVITLRGADGIPRAIAAAGFDHFTDRSS